MQCHYFHFELVNALSFYIDFLCMSLNGISSVPVCINVPIDKN